MAMRAKNAHDKLETIQLRHWHQLAMKNVGPAVRDISNGTRAQARRFVEAAAAV